MLPNGEAKVLMKLSQTTVRKLALPAGVNEKIVFDAALPGFGLRLRAGGKRTWIVQYRVGAKQRRVTLGTIETLVAEEARKRAKSALSKVHLGRDPQLEKAEARAQSAVTLGAIVERYLEERASKRLRPRTLAEVTRSLREHWKPLHAVPLTKLTRVAVAAQLGRIAKERGQIAANRSRAYLSTLYAWAIAEGLTDSNPIVGTNKAAEEISRDRVLSDQELRLVWSCAGEGDYSVIVRLLILTGQRREEVAAMRWSELDFDKNLWRIWAERTKNGLPHDLPLPIQAVEILKAHGRQEGRDLVFGSREGPFQGWSRAKGSLDSRILAELKREGENAKLQRWRLHDIRRTVATRMIELGVLPHVVEAVLNHISGHKAGVAGVYNRAAYTAEKRQALDLWAAHVVAVTKGTASNVVSLMWA
jgi:integrase